MKHIITVVIMMLLPMWTTAQNESRHVSVIPHAGVTIAKMNGAALTVAEKWKAGYTVGASVEFPLSQNFSLLTGADFSLIGTGLEKQKEKYASADEKLDVTYLSVPLQIKTYFSGVKGLAAHIGVQAGILLSAKDKMTIHSIRTMNLGNDVSSMYPMGIVQREEIGGCKQQIPQCCYWHSPWSELRMATYHPRRLLLFRTATGYQSEDRQPRWLGLQQLSNGTQLCHIYHGRI